MTLSPNPLQNMTYPLQDMTLNALIPDPLQDMTLNALIPDPLQDLAVNAILMFDILLSFRVSYVGGCSMSVVFSPLMAMTCKYHVLMCRW